MSDNDMELVFRNVDIVLSSFGAVGDVLRITHHGKTGLYRVESIAVNGTVTLAFVKWVTEARDE